jgi:hypothetical protein
VIVVAVPPLAEMSKEIEPSLLPPLVKLTAEKAPPPSVLTLVTRLTLTGVVPTEPPVNSRSSVPVGVPRLTV